MAPERNDENSRKSLIPCCLIKWFFIIHADFCRVFMWKQHIMPHIYIQRIRIYFLGWLQDPSNREGEGIISPFLISLNIHHICSISDMWHIPCYLFRPHTYLDRRVTHIIQYVFLSMRHFFNTEINKNFNIKPTCTL